MICPECGKMLPDDAGFCVRCGENLNNPNAEVYKKTKSLSENQGKAADAGKPENKGSSENQGKENNKEKTRILNIIPDEAVLRKNPDDEADKNTKEDKSAPEKDEAASKRKRRRKPAEASEDEDKITKKKAEEADDNDDDDDDEEEEESSSKFAVISVILALLICAGVIIYFFTQNSIKSREIQEQMTTTEAAETTEEYIETTTEETTETEPPVETTVITDAENNSYTIELADNIPAKVMLDTGTLRVRAYPSTDSTILGQLANGEDVTVIGSCGEWYHISYGENTGFVFSEYIQTEEPEPVSSDNTDAADLGGDDAPEENIPADMMAEDGEMPVE